MTQAEKIKLYEDLRKDLYFTFEEIAEAFNTDYEGLIQWIANTYNRTEEDVREQGEAILRARIKLAQYKMALVSPQMSIWWGIQYLGQSKEGNGIPPSQKEINETQKKLMELLTKTN